MTDIDTAAIRAINMRTNPVETDRIIRALCDALDAARAERDNLQDSLDRDLAGRKRAYQIVLRGATNADYERDQRDYWAMRDRADAAEARIDAAEEIFYGDYPAENAPTARAMALALNPTEPNPEQETQ